MISNNSFKNVKLPDKKFKIVPDLVRWAKKNKLMDKEVNQKTQLQLKEDEYVVPLKKTSKIKKINIKTGRLKNHKINKFEITKIKPKDRTLKNIPKYANKKPKVRFQDWLNLKKPSEISHSVGKSSNGKWYGWSHRAIHGFKIGDIIKPGVIGNKFEYGDKKNDMYNKLYEKNPKKANEYLKKLKQFDPYEIKSDDEAKEHAIRFAKDVS